MEPSTKFGRFDVIRELRSRGANAILYLAFDPEAKEVVVLKRLPKVQRQPDQERRFRDEIAVSMRLRHPNLVKVFDGGQIDGAPYLAIEWIVGQSLAALVDHARKYQTAIAPAICAGIIRQLLDGLAFAHSIPDLHFVHRDISPGNVMTRYDGVAQLIDYGVASSTVKATKTAIGNVVGTESFIAPERLEGKPATVASDIYSVGALLWLMLTKLQPPDMIAPPPEDEKRKRLVDAGVSGDLASVVLQAIAPDPEHRFQTADAMRDALNRAIKPATLDEIGVLVRALFAGAHRIAQDEQKAFAARFSIRAEPSAASTAVLRSADVLPAAKGARSTLVVEPLADHVDKERPPNKTRLVAAIVAAMLIAVVAVAAALIRRTNPPIATVPPPPTVVPPLPVPPPTVSPLAAPPAPPPPEPASLPPAPSKRVVERPGDHRVSPALSKKLSEVEELIRIGGFGPAAHLCVELETDAKARPQALTLHAKIHFQEGRYPDAIDYASRALKAGAGSKALLLRAQAELRAKDKEAAARDFRLVLQEDPKSREATEGLRLAER